MNMIYRKTARFLFRPVHRHVLTPLRLARSRKLPNRRLEIGPGYPRIDGFETLNVAGTWRQVDYLLDAARPLPFADKTFAIVHASHVLEHLPWYRTAEIVAEWTRIIRPGGRLEIWVPDAAKVAQVLIDIENNQSSECYPDGWWVRNEQHDPYLWVAGRLFYGAREDYPSWHQALFTPRYLRQVMEATGLQDIRQMDPKETRSVDHGWLNLGMVGSKP